MAARIPLHLLALLTSCTLLACAAQPTVPAPTQPTANPTLTANQPPETVEHKGSIEVQSSPAGLAVLLDGKPKGKTPMTIDQLAAGSYEVTYVDPDNGNVTMLVDLAEGQYRVLRHNVVPKAVDAP